MENNGKPCRKVRFYSARWTQTALLHNSSRSSGPCWSALLQWLGFGFKGGTLGVSGLLDLEGVGDVGGNVRYLSSRKMASVVDCFQVPLTQVSVRASGASCCPRSSEGAPA